MSAKERPRSLALIWAQAHGGVIGADGTMPWHLPEDLAHFKELTMGHTLVMGRATWESLPERFRPLPGRTNIVLSRTPGLRLPGASVTTSLNEAIARVAPESELWVMGGASVYRQAIGLAGRLEVTEIDLDVAGDAYAPAIGPQWRQTGAGDWRQSRTGLRYRFVSYQRRLEPEPEHRAAVDHEL